MNVNFENFWNPGFPALSAVALLLAACSFDGNDDPSRVIVTRTTNLAGNDDVAKACGRKPDHVVLINDFAYDPLNLDVKVGQTVAWVNAEFCGNALVEATSKLTGCDTHHQVVTFPMSGTDSINSGDICSPEPGVPTALGLSVPGFKVNTNSCAQEQSSNVFCHTFTSPGTQHYTCFTNPGHTLLMNGFINVTE